MEDPLKYQKMRKYMLRWYEDKGINEADVGNDLVKRITFLAFHVKNPQLCMESAG